MFSEDKVGYLKKLYENIFNEKAVNSKEFRTFVDQSNPHLLRVKVENQLIEINENVRDTLEKLDNRFEADSVVRQALLHKLVIATELDTFITDYIENNYE